MPLKTHIDEQPSLNLTSMIDVTFLLIIFFMVGTKFSEMERKIGLRVPQVANHPSLAVANDKRIVNVYRDGQITLDAKPVTVDQLTNQLAADCAHRHDLSVLVRGDADGRYKNVAEVLNACKRAGVTQLAVSVQRSKQTR
ncbi:MAG TPA: biopolymer transporter ExbD [Pirellulales bacterium]|nr:biopolymer transporter ExbD [Pirellulales bacterium]